MAGNRTTQGSPEGTNPSGDVNGRRSTISKGPPASTDAPDGVDPGAGKEETLATEGGFGDCPFHSVLRGFD
jgi:hypothetical protein